MSTVTLSPGAIIPAELVSLLCGDVISFDEISKKTGISNSQVKRNLAKMVRAGLAPASLLKIESIATLHEKYANVIVVDEAGRSLEAASSNVSASRVIAAERRAAEAEAQLQDAMSLSALLAGISSIPAKPAPLWLSEANDGVDESVPIIVLTDWHLGEVVDPAQAGGYAYNLDIAKSRIAETVSRTIAMTRRHLAGLRYPGIVVALGGDIVSGGIHAELAETDEQGILRSVITGRDLIVSAIQKLADEFGRVFVPTAVGNHGRIFDKRPRAKGYAERNADWLIYELIGDALKDDPRVSIVNPASGETIFNVYNMTFLLTHGDRLGTKGGDGIIGAIGPIMRGSLKTHRSLESLGVELDHLICGHWHQQLHLPRVTVCGALKGPDEYALRMLRTTAEDPSQTLLIVHPQHGITFRQPIFLKDEACPNKGARREAGQGWVSVFSDAA